MAPPGQSSSRSTDASPAAAAWAGFVDDATTLSGDLPAANAVFAHLGRRRSEAAEYADLMGPLVVHDLDLPGVVSAFGDESAEDLRSALEIAVVVTGGAGQIAGPAALASRSGLRLGSVEVTLRDLDDLAGNARRVVAAVDAARAEGALDEEVPVHVEIPPAGDYAWSAAADEVAGAELLLTFRLGGPDPADSPRSSDLARWIGSALDRETPFKATGGLSRALRHTDRDGERPVEAHGFLNVLLATWLAFEGGTPAETTDTLEQPRFDQLRSLVTADSVRGGRRWFRSFHATDLDEPRTDLIEWGLI